MKLDQSCDIGQTDSAQPLQKVVQIGSHETIGDRYYPQVERLLKTHKGVPPNPQKQI